MIGVLEAFNKQDGKDGPSPSRPQAFTEQDENNFSGFAAVAGATVEINLMRAERARMHRQCAHLLSLGEYMSANKDTNTERLYKSIIEEAAEMSSASQCSAR